MVGTEVFPVQCFDYLQYSEFQLYIFCSIYDFMLSKLCKFLSRHRNKNKGLFLIILEYFATFLTLE